MNLDTSNIDYKNVIKSNSMIQKIKFGTDGLEPFWIADADFPVFNKITEAVQGIVDRANYSYTLREHDFNKKLGMWFQKKHQYAKYHKPIFFQSGVLSAVAVILDLFTNEGDGVILQSPVYHAFSTTISNLNRTVVENPLLAVDNDYEIDFNNLEALFKKPEHKVLIFCNPHNPIGKIWGVEDMKKIVALAKQHDVLVISDEIHGDIVYDGEFVSMLNLLEVQNVIVVNSTAKTFGTPALADGFAFTANEEYDEILRKRVEQLHLFGGNVFTYAGTYAAIEHGEEWLEALIPHLKSLKEELIEGLKDTKIKVKSPQATYQMWMDFTAYGLTHDELVQGCVILLSVVG